MESEEEMYLLKAEVLRRGWTPKMIDASLGEPGIREKVPGLKYPVCRYARSRVEAAEQTEAFKTASAAEMIRREEARKLSAVRNAPVLEFANGCEIKIKMIPPDELEHRCKRDPESGCRRDTKFDRVLNRWKVGYIRRELSNESALHAEIAHRPGAPKAYWVIRHRVLAAIAATYPELADTCEQLQNERFERGE